MRIEKDDFVTAVQHRIQMVFVDIAHQILQTFGLAVPAHTVFQNQTRHVVKVLFEDVGALGLRQFGITMGQIDLADLAPRFDQVIAQPAHRFGKRVYHLNR